MKNLALLFLFVPLFSYSQKFIEFNDYNVDDLDKNTQKIFYFISDSMIVYKDTSRVIDTLHYFKSIGLGTHLNEGVYKGKNTEAEVVFFKDYYRYFLVYSTEEYHVRLEREISWRSSSYESDDVVFRTVYIDTVFTETHFIVNISKFVVVNGNWHWISKMSNKYNNSGEICSTIEEYVQYKPEKNRLHYIEIESVEYCDTTVTNSYERTLVAYDRKRNIKYTVRQSKYHIADEISFYRKEKLVRKITGEDTRKKRYRKLY